MSTVTVIRQEKALVYSAALAARRERALLLALAGLVIAACLPLTRVFIGIGFLASVFAAALLALGVDWAARRLGAGPLLTLAVTVAAWVLYTGLVFVPDTLIAGVVPTPGTLVAIRDMWLEALSLVRSSPAPAFPEPPLVLLCVTAVWAVAHAVDGLVIRLGAPISAIVLALVLWTVPLALAPQFSTAWAWALPFMAAAAALLLSSAGADVGRFGRWVFPDDPGGLRSKRNPLTTGGALLAVSAIVVGSLVAALLPGFGDPPWYELRGSGGTSLTTNPIVGLHSRLVSDDAGPVMRVTSPRPLYLRTTSLDHYDERREVWSIRDSITGGRAEGARLLTSDFLQAEQVPVSVEVLNLPDALLVPLPYQTVEVFDASGQDRLRYDPRRSAFFVDPSSTLQANDRFEALAAVPNPTAEQLAFADVGSDPSLVELPEIPPQVGQLARDIVERAGAETPLEQALAIQNELRSWTYSLDVVPSHRREAIVAFIEERRGYCEQYAGTMAIMLRELGIPARVAVGFTPGTPDDPALVDTGLPVDYTVSLANAHAWVEVLFGGYGWIAFEPTPRSDGNVLVPTATNLAPSQTVTPAGATPQFGPGAEELRPENDITRGFDTQPDDVAPGQTDPAGGRDGGLALPVLLVLAAAVLAIVAGLVVARLRAAAPRLPLERVLRARNRIRRLGAGLGTSPKPTETDAEYLQRLLRRLPVTAGTGSERRYRAERAVEHLGLRAEQAQWSLELPEGAAEDAEEAAADLESVLLDDRSRRARATIRGRAALMEITGRVPRISRRRDRERDRELVGAGR